MPSPLTLDEKWYFLLTGLIPMLRDDTRRLVEICCEHHGRPSLGAPNFAATAQCLIACEVMGRLTAEPRVDSDTATLEFIRRLADVSGDSRYRAAAPAINVYFRNGIVHSFRPKGAIGSIQGRVEWANACVDVLASDSGREAVAHLRKHSHLVVREHFGRNVFVVVPQVLYLDVRSAIDRFETALKNKHQSTLELLDRSFEAWWGRVADPGKLDQAARAYLADVIPSVSAG